MKWKNKLEFADASITILKNEHTENKNWLIVSYKTIFVNVYNVLIFEEESGKIKYSHKNYQLWESPVMGFLNERTNDYIILNKNGTGLLPLGKDPFRHIVVEDGTDRLVHSLQSSNFLKIEDSNLLQFERPHEG